MNHTSCTVLRARCLLVLIGGRAIDGYGTSIASLPQLRNSRRLGNGGVARSSTWDRYDPGRNVAWLLRGRCIAEWVDRLPHVTRCLSVIGTTKHDYRSGWCCILRCASWHVLRRCVRRSCRGGWDKFSSFSLHIRRGIPNFSLLAPFRLLRGFFGLKALLSLSGDLSFSLSFSSRVFLRFQAFRCFQSWTLVILFDRALAVFDLKGDVELDERQHE